ncbi:TPA: NADH-quinone oxidoreductase subunit C [Burkholderia aenigmatica]|uniref:hydrogenase large subunit n=1 Tax=Burkholderia sp. AU45251 TaxID=3059204 RepID=UPI0026559E6C|nr:NADH-quinone oxidoreductase subunit C [Burkholderia sp. AU45251]HDR9482125.1 NADH-quinone oxidoreductase subunit C [Burkholderia aenigmatica]MDN7515240.1 NADH-quinone oxidoreductase subunit C [Burkholderia sp. AU45251]HDR9515592.1 NADH-quinone oxidoreductase subunit C [Burkholderia aenigmatica]HDR9590496.1 NADH-quinone oxidoreductase subunit C [Burkholderia aenigmatica]HDR9598869.1 NADH-quinone oxidoreductase subunit C [Burkholderia aenigmatica]
MRLDLMQIGSATRLVEGAGQIPAIVTDVDESKWLEIAHAAQSEQCRLVAMWGDEAPERVFTVNAAYECEDGILWVRLATGDKPRPEGDFPDLAEIFPYAARMQRAIFDLIGLRARAALDTRPWLHHGNWPADYFPLQTQATGVERFESNEADYPFVRVAGDGVHEIAVGPIHAGTIEPGHFRFSVVGEKVLRLEERLGYVHRGVERLFERTAASNGHRVAGRVAGDSTVAFSWAYCMALEQAYGVEPSRRALYVRALLLERERIANHLGDLGALGNDAGFGFGLAQFSRFKEDWIRMNARAFGHRYLMDRVVPGGVAVDLSLEHAAELSVQCESIERDVHAMRQIYDDQSGLQDRFLGTGRLKPDVVEHFGVRGMAARASGRAFDLRADLQAAPYGDLTVKTVSDVRGDVAARVAVRFAEIDESLRLIRLLLANLPRGPIVVDVTPAAGRSRGIGWVEGWRGDVFVALETAPDDAVVRCHCHDPSWQNWPALEHAIIGNIVPDFPLINKSFNLNYAGHDL